MPSAVDSVNAFDSIYVLLSDVPPIDDMNSSAFGLNASKMADVGITVSRAKDPTGVTGAANNFQLLGIRIFDLETGATQYGRVLVTPSINFFFLGF